VSKPSLYLKINANELKPGEHRDERLEYQGILEFKMDGRSRAETFVLNYGPGFEPINLKFDATTLSRFQKDVSRYLGGFLKKEWQEREKKGQKEAKYSKTFNNFKRDVR
jgi:hypothetical protein